MFVKVARSHQRLVGLLIRPAAAQLLPASSALMRWPRFLCGENPRLTIPDWIVDVSHSRSSGPGGQNVNKVSTKVSLRLQLDRLSAHIPHDALLRLREQQHSRITKGDELLISCDEERTQARNSQLAFKRLQGMLDQAAVIPKERIISLEPPEQVKQQRRREKRQHSHKKQARRSNTDWN